MNIKGRSKYLDGGSRISNAKKIEHHNKYGQFGTNRTNTSKEELNDHLK